MLADALSFVQQLGADKNMKFMPATKCDGETSSLVLGQNKLPDHHPPIMQLSPTHHRQTSANGELIICDPE
jgi:hypothetical protein